MPETSSEGQLEAIENTRIAAEDHMVEVTDQNCQAVTLSFQAETQTNVIE